MIFLTLSSCPTPNLLRRDQPKHCTEEVQKQMSLLINVWLYVSLLLTSQDTNFTYFRMNYSERKALSYAQHTSTVFVKQHSCCKGVQLQDLEEKKNTHTHNREKRHGVIRIKGFLVKWLWVSILVLILPYR